MKNPFKAYYEEFFEIPDRFSRVSGVLIIILALFGIVLIVFVCGWFIDQSGSQTYHSKAVVIGCKYIPAHSTTTVMMTGKMFMPVTTYHSDDYRVDINLDGELTSASVSKDFYKTIKIGDSLEVEYTKGTFTSKAYPTNVKKLDH